MYSLSRFSDADLPTAHGVFRVVVYRVNDDPKDEHVAMVCGEVKGGHDVLVRVHSECLTGEVLGSLRCDCRDQLAQALARIGAEGRGVLVYLRQEGRGIGLGNKVRAYALQDQGVDTVEANVALGFDPDLRSYEIAAGILAELGLASVRLMTNNPAKIEGLGRAGIAVTSQESHWVASSEHSAAYLKVKQNKLGHIPEPGATSTAQVDKDTRGK